jgi:hypothetical protein
MCAVLRVHGVPVAQDDVPRARLQAPRAAVVASHPVWSRSGEQAFRLVTGSVRCTATIGGAKAAVKAALAAGRATCTITTPKSARRKALRGTIVTTSGGLRLVKSFTATLR